eukprot:TRINITY_DN11134_c0_g1_i1.p1 TRINITY_DN11134_c0_g1~~TRINITY_DN11134_c0_g1_i1.p1  ORF type:complete len:321 (+),score=53.75 TRINITY_DN11134_c0_g1_i1:125-964(+)
MLAQLLAKKNQLKPAITMIKTKTGISCALIKDEPYEMVTIDGAGVIIVEHDFYALYSEEGTAMLRVEKGEREYMFKLVEGEVPEGSFHWYGRYYVPVDEVPVRRLLENPESVMVPFVIDGDDVERPRSSVIEGAHQPQLFDIIPGFGLFLGSQDAAINVEGLQQNGVTHILNVATGIEIVPPNEEYTTTYTFCSIPILDVDDADITRIFNECFEFIDAGREAGGVLVHCNAGVSRSASVVIAYLMRRNNMTFEEAYNQTKSVKSDIKPNDGFMRQLKEF